MSISVVLLLIVATAMVTAVVASRETKSIVAVPAAPFRMSLIGDSFTSGFNNGVVWPSLLANDSNLSISNVAYPGSGYVGSAGESAPFAAQLDKALASKPELVVIFGGANDVYNSIDLVKQSAIDLFTELSRRTPTTELLVLGPIWHEDPPPQRFLNVDSALADAADKANAAYVPLIQETWLVGDGLVQRDDFNLTDEGQAILARRLGPVLKSQIRALRGDVWQ
ncbi:SGNH/GDSL hydrolase family protein [Mycobacterium sp. CPCC 205372]|uniref:SGNH/GDSL hydrolase family protein n=1 Tax=Mycobacterium hippophais TaxID=3016340 RepID=A0ABT4PRT1_9MYCO|nr:SGNH/GDSL hydrolase family protein [Mycobacterium hippophais]MCZ8379264.1 SGNH/GDSL hydrolase family protein [Mycobacterium hippophais]